MKLTEWYPAHIKPVRVGVYNVETWANPDSPWFSYWDGNIFNYYCNSVDDAFRNRRKWGCGKATSQWRGIAK